MKHLCPIICLLTVVGLGPTQADVLKAAVVGCVTISDAEKISALQMKDRAGAAALSQHLVASRACIAFAKGLKIDVDERRPPLACIRLPGDLSCYWVAAASIDEHPGEKGSSGGGGQRSGKRH